MFVVFCFGAITEGMLLSARVFVNSFFQKLERWKIWIQWCKLKDMIYHETVQIGVKLTFPWTKPPKISSQFKQYDSLINIATELETVMIPPIFNKNRSTEKLLILNSRNRFSYTKSLISLRAGSRGYNIKAVRKWPKMNFTLETTICDVRLLLWVMNLTNNNNEYGAEDLKSVHSPSIILAPCICLVRGASFVQNPWRGLLNCSEGGRNTGGW